MNNNEINIIIKNVKINNSIFSSVKTIEYLIIINIIEMNFKIIVLEPLSYNPIKICSKMEMMILIIS